VPQPVKEKARSPSRVLLPRNIFLWMTARYRVPPGPSGQADNGQDRVLMSCPGSA
jgi:hypothetical protein